MNNYHIISSTKEDVDTTALIEQIKSDEWINGDTIIVNCFPQYSSRLCQTINHKLSHLNKNELFEVINLEMPYPNTNQVWNGTNQAYENYDTYLKNWVTSNIFYNNFLFVASDMVNIRNFNKIRLEVRRVLQRENHRFASLYCLENTSIHPDYFAEMISEPKRIVFQWENANNPNFKNKLYE